MGERAGLVAKTREIKKEISNSRVQQTVRHGSMGTSADSILFLQRTVGNRAVSKLIRSGGLQAKLRIGQPGDMYEQEADRVADEVMRITEPTAASGVSTQIHRACSGCEEEEEVLQTKEISGQNAETTPNLESRINNIRGGGQPLAESERAFFEQRFGYDFGQVRMHTDTRAAETAQAVNARAYTVGRDVVLGAGQYAPGTSEGRRLLAHELTHVVQQGDMGAPSLQRRALLIQRTIRDGHDLRSSRFAGDSVLEAVYDGERLLKRGHRGPAVEKVQKAFVDAECPLPRFGADGDFGGETQRAVMCFQRASGLTGPDVDGIVGPTTMSRLDARFGGPPRPGGGGSGGEYCGLPDEGSEEAGPRLVRSPQQDDATIVCDGEGDYRGDLRGYALAPCYFNECVRLHEGVHCEDWRERWPYGCKKADRVTPRPNGAKVPLGGPGYNEFLNSSECRAYKIGGLCAAALISGSSAKCKNWLEIKVADTKKILNDRGCR